MLKELLGIEAPLKGKKAAPDPAGSTTHLFAFTSHQITHTSFPLCCASAAAESIAALLMIIGMLLVIWAIVSMILTALASVPNKKIIAAADVGGLLLCNLVLFKGVPDLSQPNEVQLNFLKTSAVTHPSTHSPIHPFTQQANPTPHLPYAILRTSTREPSTSHRGGCR